MAECSYNGYNGRVQDAVCWTLEVWLPDCTALYAVHWQLSKNGTFFSVNILVTILWSWWHKLSEITVIRLKNNRRQCQLSVALPIYWPWLAPWVSEKLSEITVIRLKNNRRQYQLSVALPIYWPWLAPWLMIASDRWRQGPWCHLSDAMAPVILSYSWHDLDKVYPAAQTYYIGEVSPYI